MDPRTAAGTPAPLPPEDRELIRQFAGRVRRKYAPRGRLYLFGSRARGTAGAWSDYDLVFVSGAFAGQERRQRVRDRHAIWREAGGTGKPLDLHVYTPDEFRAARRGVTFLSDAERRSELVRVA